MKTNRKQEKLIKYNILERKGCSVWSSNTYKVRTADRLQVYLNCDRANYGGLHTDEKNQLKHIGA